jgi:UDP-N-acetylglucosamine 3-dehydrogenase
VSRPLRAGLVGLGAMGRQHARVLQSLPDVELVGAVDPQEETRARSIGVAAVGTLDRLLDRGIDLCVVATPTITHADIAIALAEAGVATMIEKPLAPDPKTAQTIVEAFRREGVPGCVGHIERFNPALQDMRVRLARGELGEIYQVITRRQGPFPARIVDAGVVVDLATHDIDLTGWVTGSSYRSLSARTAHRSGRPHEDLVSVVAELADGTVVTHLVNWLSPFKERITTVTGDLGTFVADTVTADLTYFQNGSEPAQWERVAAFRGVSEGHMTRYAIPKPEPLVTELSRFAALVRGEDVEVVTLEEGHGTVEIAAAVRRSAESGETVVIDR